jgi:hypothetical protein
LGYPADDNRLVQRWAWYSLADDYFNGWLFDRSAGRRTVFGDHFASLTAARAATVNLRPVSLRLEASPMSSGQAVSVTLAAELVNNGDAATPTAFPVRFYDGDPNAGGQPLGPDVWVGPLDGCAWRATARLTWPQAPPGLHTLWVVADPSGVVGETSEGDNALSAQILIPTARLFLPIAVDGP